MVRSGELKEGDVLPSEQELMEEFQVGRSALREAFLALQHKGIIATSNGERSRISRPDAPKLIEALSGAACVILATDDGVVSFQDARIFQESAIAREVARKANKEDINRIGNALKDNERSIPDAISFEQTDVKFHLEIAKTLGNLLISGLHEALTGWLSEQRSVALMNKGTMERAFEFHSTIYAAIRDRDTDLAEKAMRDHLSEVKTLYWKARQH
jgi:GntR family transcriptional regulator, sialic acid-inducible nan operon repressor